MSTIKRKRWSNVLIGVAILFIAILWTYGAQMSREASRQASRNRAWRDIVDHSPSAVVVADAEGTIVQWSVGAEELLGWTKNQAEGADLQLIMAPERYQQHKAGFYDERRRVQLKNGGVLQVRGYVLSASGKIIEVDVRITAVRNGAIFFVATITRAEEVIEEENPPLPPLQTQYDPPDIQKFKD